MPRNSLCKKADLRTVLSHYFILYQPRHYTFTGAGCGGRGVGDGGRGGGGGHGCGGGGGRGNSGRGDCSGSLERKKTEKIVSVLTNIKKRVYKTFKI